MNCGRFPTTERTLIPGLHYAARGPLAQLVEQGTLNPKVEGSNPSRPIYECPAKRLISGRGEAAGGHVGATQGAIQREKSAQDSTATARAGATSAARNRPQDF